MNNLNIVKDTQSSTEKRFPLEISDKTHPKISSLVNSFISFWITFKSSNIAKVSTQIPLFDIVNKSEKKLLQVQLINCRISAKYL